MKNKETLSIISSKNFIPIFFTILFLYFFGLNVYQMHDQHWTAMLDQDIKMIYNSLLISSGFEQAYRDHPAYTTFLILGGIFKICSIFFDNFTIQEVLAADNIDKEFQKLFYIARVINGFYIFLVTFFIYKILIELKVSNFISILSTSLSLFFISFYELLFLVRSEIVSVLMFLISFYFLTKFLNRNNIIYIILTGFFFCLSMLAKIQVIFLYFVILIALPFLIYYLDVSKKLHHLIKKNKFLELSKIVIILFFGLYILSQLILSKNFLSELNDPAFSLLHNEDLILLLFFVSIYFLFIKLLSKYYLINSNLVVISIGMIITGFVICLLIVFLLDVTNIIPFHELNLLRLTNPIKFMTIHTFEMRHEVSILITIKALIQAALGFYDLSAQFNEAYNPTILSIDTKIFFRNLHLLLLLLLIIFSFFKIKDKNLIYLSIVFLLGTSIYYLIFLLRETTGYNIFLFLLYVITISILLNRLNKKYYFMMYSIFLLVFLLENFLLSSIYKNVFSREPSVYKICNIEKWKNSVNYVKNYNNRSYIKLVGDVDIWIKVYANKFYKITDIYCIQLRDEEGNRETEFKIN
ncbi:MAG: hypothetical protein CMP44_03955 [Rickettsiales bacterium]|nr:hypothetical protein [Rickettsiales bacterium]